MKHANTELTPYDTGALLEPQLWVAGGPVEGGAPRRVRREDYGRVDFDDEAGRTVLTLHVSRTAAGYTLHVANLTDPLTVEVDAEQGVGPAS